MTVIVSQNWNENEKHEILKLSIAVGKMCFIIGSSGTGTGSISKRTYSNEVRETKVFKRIFVWLYPKSICLSCVEFTLLAFNRGTAIIAYDFPKVMLAEIRSGIAVLASSIFMVRPVQ